MAEQNRVYPGSELSVRGYVKEVTYRNDYATLHVYTPPRTYEGKTYPGEVHKFDVTKSFNEAVAQLTPHAAVNVTGRGSAREWTTPDGEVKVFVSWRMSGLQPCNELPVVQPPLPPADDNTIPF